MLALLLKLNDGHFCDPRICGNKIYIGYNTDATKENSSYPISITVTGFGSNSIYNNKCDLIVYRTSFTYRPIEVTNPFINSEWKKVRTGLIINYMISQV